MISQILFNTLPDGGPLYRETDLNRFVSEPWNAYSSLSFLIPAFLFLYQVRGEYKKFAFLVFYCAPMLILGGLGSTFFHAFRSSRFFLMMDVLPILALTLGISIYFWWKVIHPKFWVFIIFLGFTGLFYLLGRFLEGQDRISGGYVLRGTMLFLPCFLYLRKMKLTDVKDFALAVVFFILALIFRFTDEKWDILPMGTHFLWHIFCALGAYFLGEYLVKNRRKELEE